MLFDWPSPNDQYMDEEIIITKAPGSCDMIDDEDHVRVRQLTKNQTYQSAHIATFEKNMLEKLPIGVIFGKLIPDVYGHLLY